MPSLKEDGLSAGRDAVCALDCSVNQVQFGAPTSVQVPGVLLMVRNSTDTAYFQRLRPYPRILLRRLAARFKDYDKSPIGFGIVVFCIVKENCR